MPRSLGGIWRNLDESGEICERKSAMHSRIQPRTVLFWYQPNAAAKLLPSFQQKAVIHDQVTHAITISLERGIVYVEAY